VDNGHYGETGYQKSHTSLGVDLEKIASASGVKRTRTIANEAGLAEGGRMLREGNGTAFIVLKVKPDDPPPYKRNLDPASCRLRIDRAHLYGQCIGGSFIINMLKRHPERVAAAVLAQPIGRVGPLKPEWNANFKGWTETLKDRPDATQAVLDAFYRNLYAPGFVYFADRDFVKTIKAPCLVLAGNDEAHPWPIYEE